VPRLAGVPGHPLPSDGLSGHPWPARASGASRAARLTLGHPALAAPAACVHFRRHPWRLILADRSAFSPELESPIKSWPDGFSLLASNFREAHASSRGRPVPPHAGQRASRDRPPGLLLRNLRSSAIHGLRHCHCPRSRPGSRSMRPASCCRRRLPFTSGAIPGASSSLIARRSLQSSNPRQLSSGRILARVSARATWPQVGAGNRTSNYPSGAPPTGFPKIGQIQGPDTDLRIWVGVRRHHGIPHRDWSLRGSFPARAAMCPSRSLDGGSEGYGREAAHGWAANAGCGEDSPEAEYAECTPRRSRPAGVPSDGEHESPSGKIDSCSGVNAERLARMRRHGWRRK
jgi:hypothetical protein